MAVSRLIMVRFSIRKKFLNLWVGRHLKNKTEMLFCFSIGPKNRHISRSANLQINWPWPYDQMYEDTSTRNYYKRAEKFMEWADIQKMSGLRIDRKWPQHRLKKYWVSTNPSDHILPQAWIFYICDEGDKIPMSAFCSIEVSYSRSQAR